MAKDIAVVNSLKAGLTHVSKQLARVSRGTVAVIAIAGISASGKTTFCKMLHNRFPCSVVISLDDYFYGRAYMQQNGLTTFDDPRSVNLDLAAQHLAMLKSGQVIAKPRYSFATSEPERMADLIEPARFVFVEGLYALREPIIGMADIKIFVDADVHGTLWRRIIRDVSRTGQTPEQIAAMFLNEVHPSNVEFILPTKDSADVIIRNNTLPSELRSKLVEHQYQQKMLVTDSYSEAERNRVVGILASAGFHEVMNLSQQDVWLVPPSQKDVSDDELMRIREEVQWGSSKNLLTLTCKIPADGPDRALFQFSITNEIRDGLTRIGYRRGKSLMKDRKVFRSHDRGDEIVLDLILGEDVKVFLYLEVRSDSLKELEECVRMLCDRGVQQSKLTYASYRDIFA